MSHGEHIAALVRAGRGAAAHRSAEEHVARCSDCWAVVSLLHELATGAPPAEAGRMADLFGCAPVQDRLYLLPGLDAAALRATEPALARHLGWCVSCRERAAEILLVEAAAARGEFAAARTRWRETAASVREVVGRTVVQLRRAGAVFTAVPEGFIVAPGFVPAGAFRGGDEASTEPGLGRQVGFPLGDSGLWADVWLESQGTDGVGVSVNVSGDAERRLSIHVREVHEDRTELLARQTVQDDAPAVIGGLEPGHYLLEIEDKIRNQRFQLRFDVESAV
jgi:hypothetical protein